MTGFALRLWYVWLRLFVLEDVSAYTDYRYYPVVWQLYFFIGVAQKALGYPTPVTAPLVPRTALDTSNDKIIVVARVCVASNR
jgi:hypothetical protein